MQVYDRKIPLFGLKFGFLDSWSSWQTKKKQLFINYFHISSLLSEKFQSLFNLTSGNPKLLDDISYLIKVGLLSFGILRNLGLPEVYRKLLSYIQYGENIYTFLGGVYDSPKRMCVHVCVLVQNCLAVGWDKWREK